MQLGQRCVRVRRVALVVGYELQTGRAERVEHVEHVEHEWSLVFETDRDRVLQHALVQNVREQPGVLGLVGFRHNAIDTTATPLVPP